MSRDPEPSARRTLAEPAFPGDRGAAEPELTTALAAYSGDRSRYADVLAVLLDARLLVAIVPVLGETAPGAHGLVVDKSADMAVVLMTGADGRAALLVFSGLETLHAWDPQARPTAVSARDAARAALQDGAAALVLDVAGPTSYVVEGEDLDALARGWRLARVGERTAWIGPDAP